MIASAAARPSALRVWMRAVRIFSFTASITPVLVGSAFALVDRRFAASLFLPILAACVLVHAGCNLANDYFDYVKGTDRENVLGPEGWLSAEQIRLGMIVSFTAATILGLLILALSTWWLLALAIPSLLAAVLYTGGPKPLGYAALGLTDHNTIGGAALPGRGNSPCQQHSGYGGRRPGRQADTRAAPRCGWRPRRAHGPARGRVRKRRAPCRDPSG